MSDYNDRSSLYDNSDYPSRRQAPGPSRSSGERRRTEDPRRSSAPRKRRRKRRGSSIWRAVSIFLKVVGTLFLIGLCTGVLLACFAAVYINEVIVPKADLSLDDFPLGEDSIMYYQDKATGQYVEMVRLNNVTSSVWVDFEDMPEDLINATVAIEDKRFWTHPGVDWRRTAYAVYSMFTGKEISGGSTITQQMIKNTTLENETTVKRKITEIVRAIRFTQNNSKEDTLERYLNIIPLGSKYKGVGSAALGYFGKPVSELTLAECASLISITNNPSKYGPYSFGKSQGVNTDEIWDARQWNKYRQEVVLWQMLEQGMISREEYDEAVAQELVFAKDQDQDSSSEIYYTWYEETVISDVKEALGAKFGWSESVAEQALARGGLRIYTCYDPNAQAIVDQIYTDRANLDYTSKEGQQMQSAICVIDNQTGDVVAIAGQFGVKNVNFGSNYANNGRRQPGSSFKPLAVYSPALEFHKANPYTVLDDYPYRENGGKAWPLNSGTTHYKGQLTMREALKQSLNTVAVRLMNDYVTPEESFKFVQDRYHIDLEEGRMVGDEWKTDITESLAMGGLTDGTNVRDMAEAYCVFPNNGYYQGSRTFTKVTQLVDGEEVVLMENELVPEPSISANTAWYMNDMLKHVFDGGGTAAGRGIPGQNAAGKTGTTSDNKDRWFVGYTPYYTAAVWTGYEKGYKMNLRDVNPALVLWQKVMIPLHEGLEKKDYQDPGGRRPLTYCLDSGLPASEWCALDPRGSRVATGAVFPEDYPEGLICTAHTAETVIAVCTGCPVAKEDGTPTGLYYQAGPYCPEESIKKICYPNYPREQVGAAVADDALWRYETVSSYGLCTVHTEPEEPEPGPEDPNFPVDPNAPYLPFPPIDPGGTTDPTDPGQSTQPDQGSAGPSGSSGTGGVRPDVAPQLPGTAVRPGVAPEQ
ncbi:MAG: penicillin-binding protein [Lawsonibacter sp.]|nr:penicillin-binding protein [Lawsonibacter sp.]